MRSGSETGEENAKEKGSETGLRTDIEREMARTNDTIETEKRTNGETETLTDATETNVFLLSARFSCLVFRRRNTCLFVSHIVNKRFFKFYHTHARPLTYKYFIIDTNDTSDTKSKIDLLY